MNPPRLSLDDYLKSLPNRCPGCGYHPRTQGCACAGERLKFSGQAITTAAHPDDRAKVEAAIRQLAATGRPFSANDARSLHGVVGGVVGATFTAMRKAGVIKSCGDDDSTGESAHGHRIYRWVSASAVAA
ncbi:hypothetical protein [Nocardioides sp. URHA0032]|uniref:hypothetical protein n=1 Tax=Nocardioides sp. URHA0032 TaxID=1380388 RepID=UPI000684FE45|nr:hypothetical protein [Nocardioides sp. URHA0032]